MNTTDIEHAGAVGVTSAEYRPLHALVATVGGKSLLLCASRAIIEDMAECGAGHDLDDGGPPQPESDGLWVWEGKMTWRRGASSYYGEGDDEVDYKGDYRRATDEEARKILLGEAIWPADLLPDPDDDRDPPHL